MKPKIIVIVGPTSSGKSELAVRIAKKYRGEIISADSRQIYRGMDIGSGKVTGKWQGGQFIYKGIPHYLIDEASPKRQYSVARFQNRSRAIIKDVLTRGNLPIICGGTAHWVDALVFDQILPAVKPSSSLRRRLAKLSPAELFTRLQNLDPGRASEIDPHNPRRLIRALEIVMTTGRPVPKLNSRSPYGAVWIGINPSAKILETKIKSRLKARFKQGMIKEVERLHRAGLSWQRLESFGLEYKYCALYLQGQLTKSELEDQLFNAHRKFVKRQLTWWKRNKKINWLKTTTAIPHQLLK